VGSKIHKKRLCARLSRFFRLNHSHWQTSMASTTSNTNQGVPSSGVNQDISTHASNHLRRRDVQARLASVVGGSHSGQPAFATAVASFMSASRSRRPTSTDLQRLVNQLGGTLTDPRFYRRLLDTMWAWVKAHPWQTAGIVVGLILIINPVALAGFGASGPVAGKSRISTHTLCSIADADPFLQVPSLPHGKHP
jgi:hypothetical protein